MFFGLAFGSLEFLICCANSTPGLKSITVNKRKLNNKHTQRIQEFTWFGKLLTSTETTEKFHYKKQGDTIVHKNTFMKPKSQYTLTLSLTHKTRKLYSSSYAAAAHQVNWNNLYITLQHNLIYLFIYLSQVGLYQEIHSQLYSVILDRLTKRWAWASVAIQATHVNNSLIWVEIKCHLVYKKKNHY